MRVRAVPVAARCDEIWEQWSLPRAVKDSGVELFHSPANTTMVLSPCRLLVTIHDTFSHEAACGWGFRSNVYWIILQPRAYRRGIRSSLSAGNAIRDKYRRSGRGGNRPEWISGCIAKTGGKSFPLSAAEPSSASRR